ncbi:MAG: ABC transporter substrate-binding protein [bacterium]
MSGASRATDSNGRRRTFAALVVCLFGIGHWPLLAGGDREPVAAAPDAVEIEFWETQTSIGSYTRVADELTGSYNSLNDDVTVRYQVIPWDGWYQVFFTAVMSGRGPDVSGGAFPQPIQYAMLGETLDLSPILEAWRDERPGFVEGFVDGALPLYQYEGKQVGLPRFVDPRVITYRTDVLADLGIEALPTTWQELEQLCRTIQARTDLAPLVLKAGDIMATHVLLHFMLQADSGIVDERGEPAVDTAGTVEALRFLQRMYQDGLIAAAAIRMRGDEARATYLRGEAAMIFSYPFSQEAEASDVLSSSAVLPVLRGPGGDQRVLSWIAPIMAYRQTSSQEATLDFVKWWIENADPVWTVGRFPFLPAHTSLWDEVVRESNALLYEVANKVMPHAVLPMWPLESLFPEFHRIEGENLLGAALTSVLLGRASPEEAATRLQAEIELIFYGG